MPHVQDVAPKYLHTERLTLELFDQDDREHGEFAIEIINSRTTIERLGDLGIKTPEQFKEMNKSTLLIDPIELKETFMYLLRIGGPDGPLAGGVSLGQHTRSIPPDIGWVMHEKYMGKGYATEAAKEYLRFLTEDFGLKGNVVTWPSEGNRQSNRVAEKLGFVDGGMVNNGDKEGTKVAILILPGMKKMDENATIWMFPEPNQKEE